MNIKETLIKKEEQTSATLRPQGEIVQIKKRQFSATSLSSVSNIWWQTTILSIAILVVRLLTLPNFAEARDSLFFVRGVQRYSVYELRPHWPGYPVYIWLGDLFRLLFTDPVQALHLVSIVASTLTIWPIAALASPWRLAGGGKPGEANLAGVAAGLIWALVSLS